MGVKGACNNNIFENGENRFCLLKLKIGNEESKEGIKIQSCLQLLINDLQRLSYSLEIHPTPSL